MLKDPTKFRERFQAWKGGKDVYNAGRPIGYEGGKDDVGSVGKSLGTEIFKILDPTGISSWGDVKRSWGELHDDFTIGNAANALLETAGAIPMFGKIGKTAKILKNSPKYASKAVKFAKSFAKEENTIDDAIRLRNALRSSFSSAKNYIKPKAKLDVLSSRARVGKFTRNISDPEWRKDVAVYESEHSGGEPSPFIYRTARADKSELLYNGMFRSNDEKIGPFADYSKDQNIIRLAMYGDETGFKRAHIDPIVSNGEVVGNPNKYYYGTILPLRNDTMYIPDKYKPIFKPGLILRALQPDNIIDNTYNQYIVDAKQYAYGLKDGRIIAFDPYDNGIKNGGLLGVAWDFATNPSKKYPNSGIPTFVQNIPIQFKPGNLNSREFLDFNNFILSLRPDLLQNAQDFIDAYEQIRNNPNFKRGKDSGIHIKPSHRGKFTALKKRTGHSASWFKAHGTPALKKMATFALNARKWKH